MKKLLAKIALFLIGWKIKGRVPEQFDKCVIIAAPHTSNSDFFIGRLAFYVLGLTPVHFLIKKEAFKFPFGVMLKMAGGIPVDRANSNHTISEIAEMFKKNDSFYFVITPEGTRKRTTRWKKGFYHIAKAAEVPIALSYVDYKKKEGGIEKIIYTDKSETDVMQEIYEYYKDVTAKYPEMFNLSPSVDKDVKKEKNTKDLKNQYCCRR